MVEVAPPSPPLFVFFPKTSAGNRLDDAGDRLDDTMQQLDIFQLDASTYFLAIYQLLELEMTTLGRQIDDLNLHSPSSLVFKKTERSKLHSLACQGFAFSQ